ncbi:ATP synthase B chain [Cutibacterium acnes JCM 18918]|nr:ATP synthase B chain [Cutibacterium acnes JCM 18918]
MDLGPLAPEHPIEIIVGVILVLLLTWLIAKAVVPRFEKLYEERTETIQGGIERAERLRLRLKRLLRSTRLSWPARAMRLPRYVMTRRVREHRLLRRCVPTPRKRPIGSPSVPTLKSRPSAIRRCARCVPRSAALRPPCQSDRGGVPTRRPARPGDRRPLPLIARRRALGV